MGIHARKTKQRLEESRDDYSLYKLKRDSLLEQELVELEKLEEAFKSGTMYENPITGEKVSSGKCKMLLRSQEISKSK